MAKKFRDLVAKTMSPEAQARAHKLAQEDLAAMPLHELRRARARSQQMLAQAMETTQPEISRIEQRADMYVSTVRSYVEALGGRLDLVATFADGSSCRINQFSELDEKKEGPKPTKPSATAGFLLAKNLSRSIIATAKQGVRVRKAGDKAHVAVTQKRKSD
jgi:hypothetical protein